MAKSRQVRHAGAPRPTLTGAPTVLAWRLNYVANWFTGPFYRRIERDFSLTRPDFVVLFCLAERPGLLARDIVSLSGRPKNSISRAVNEMIRRGYVEVGEGAGRARPLTLTEAGAAAVAATRPYLIERERLMLAPLDEGERAALGRLLEKLSVRTDGFDRDE